MHEPTLRVGLLLGAKRAEIDLEGDFDVELDGVSRGAKSDRIVATLADGAIVIEGVGAGASFRLTPRDPEASTFLLREMIVGVAFHWEHTEDLRFRGAIHLVSRGDTLDVVNEVPLEEYLVSVISSEMSAECPGASLRAHAVISRSWLLAQILADKGTRPTGDGFDEPVEDADGALSIQRWYDREDHDDFDVCADDHCQRYQGVTRSYSDAAKRAVRDTRGLVLSHEGQVCDARFSKCCGGMTEVFESAWGDEPMGYLQAFVDGEVETFDLPLEDEANARSFIEGTPEAFCNTSDRELLDRILPDLDHDTQDFYRWEVTVPQADVRKYVLQKTGVDTGPVVRLEPLLRGPSGRLIRLAVVGTDRTLKVGKELEIRRLLSPTHLYSSAFVVEPQGGDDGVPEEFVLRGAGWGHGVGLCQIGAAVMAGRGYTHEQILAHYYRGGDIRKLYS